MLRSVRIYGLAILGTALSLAACGGDSSGGGQMQLAVADTPVGGAQSVLVKFNGVEKSHSERHRRHRRSDDDGRYLLTLGLCHPDSPAPFPVERPSLREQPHEAKSRHANPAAALNRTAQHILAHARGNRA